MKRQPSREEPETAVIPEWHAGHSLVGHLWVGSNCYGVSFERTAPVTGVLGSEKRGSVCRDLCLAPRTV